MIDKDIAKILKYVKKHNSNNVLGLQKEMNHMSAQKLYELLYDISNWSRVKEKNDKVYIKSQCYDPEYLLVIQEGDFSKYFIDRDITITLEGRQALSKYRFEHIKLNWANWLSIIAIAISATALLVSIFKRGG